LVILLDIFHDWELAFAARIVIRYQICIVGYFSWLIPHLHGTDCDKISIFYCWIFFMIESSPSRDRLWQDINFLLLDIFHDWELAFAGRIVIRYQFFIGGYLSWLRACLRWTDCDKISIFYCWIFFMIESSPSWDGLW